ncbi:MAG: DUF488 domain-containing protein [Pseudomonadota bacterium]
MKLPFFTIGHSNRSFEQFIPLLAEADIGLVVDIRTVPKSRTNPQFNEDALPGALAAFDISYEHIAALGGLRGKTKTLSQDVNGFWTNESFHNYADYALSAQFHAGLELLLHDGRERRCAIMCSEAVWWRCHRRIVADYLIAGGEAVFHIMGQGRLEPARLTPGAVIRSDGTVVYPVAQ